MQFEAEALDRRNANLLQNKRSTEGLDRALRSAGRSVDRAAAMLGVSVDATEKAAKVLKAGAPELIAAVESEAISLHAANAVSRLPRRQQEQLVDAGRVKEAVAQMRKAKAPTEQKVDAPPPTPEPQVSPTPPTAETGTLAVVLAALPEDRRRVAKTLVATTIRVVKECSTAPPDDVDLALCGLTALVERTRELLRGGNAGHFLRGPDEPWDWAQEERQGSGASGSHRSRVRGGLDPLRARSITSRASRPHFRGSAHSARGLRDQPSSSRPHPLVRG